MDNPPEGLDQIDWKVLLSILYAKKYDKGLSIEMQSDIWKGGLGQKGLDYSIAYMKSLIF